MLRQSFCHVPGVGGATERELWRAGCHDWDCYLQDHARYSVGSAGRDAVRRHIELSAQALADGNHQFFNETLGQRESWRAYPEFKSRAVYLDIETDGGQFEDNITTIGVSDGESYRCFVKGIDLYEFPDFISHASVLVTFFGTGFDIPVLRRAFPMVPFDQIHIDLCHGLKRLGYRGGLKKIEQQVGIQRSAATVGLTGYDAVRLWRSYLYGNESALELLIAYNREDVVNLIELARLCYKKMRALTLFEAELTERDLPYRFASLV